MSEREGRDESRDFDALVAELAGRAAALQRIAGAMTVLAGTIAAVDLERGRAELGEVLQTLDQLEQFSAQPHTAVGLVGDRLHGIAITLESALYMGGINAGEGQSVFTLKKELEDILQR
jgi:hypothetical protein